MIIPNVSDMPSLAPQIDAYSSKSPGNDSYFINLSPHPHATPSTFPQVLLEIWQFTVLTRAWGGAEKDIR